MAAAIAAAWDWAVSAAIRALIACFPSRHRVIPRSDAPEIPLLEQFAVLRQTRKLGALYLQRFVSPEAPGVFHRHQWRRMRSFVLSGEFTEERAPIAYVGYNTTGIGVGGDALWRPYHYGARSGGYITHRRFQTYTMDRSVVHRTHAWGPRCWTLFWMSSPKLEDWGYYDADRGFAFTHWRDRIKKQIPSLDKPGALT